MKITNSAGLPDLIVRAVESDPYSKAGSDYSVTQLLDPPQLRKLMRDHADDISEDVSDRMWALFGSAGHVVLERAAGPGDLSEQRFYMPTPVGVVSGQIDHYAPETGQLTDAKVTSVYKVKEAKVSGIPEWTAQLNMQACLMRHSGIYPQQLNIMAICRDWTKSRAANEKDYPNKVELIDIPMWGESKALEYLTERAVLHHEVMEDGLELPCSDHERWKRDDTYAVMRKGRKRALRVLESKELVRQYLVENGLAEPDDKGHMHLADDIYVETRPGAYVRCDEYCPVSMYCKQYKWEGE